MRRLGLVAAAALLAGCGSSAPGPPHGGPIIRLAIPAEPAALDPAKVSDLSSLNIAHELYAGLTRFSGRRIVPDLAESWEPSRDGLVWTFHLRKGIRWSDGRPITAEDFRSSWLRALAPATHSAYAQLEMGNIAGARGFHATGRGEVGVEALDARTLRVTLGHPVPWLDEQVAWPVFFPAPRGSEWSGPFRLASRQKGRLVLERNRAYWNASAVKPRQIILTTSFRHVDGLLPESRAAPGVAWVQNGINPVVARRGLPRLAVVLLWLITKGTPLADEGTRRFVAAAIGQKELVKRYLALRKEGAEQPLSTVVPPAMPGAREIGSGKKPTAAGSRMLKLTLAYAVEDVYGEETVFGLRNQLARVGVRVELKPVVTLAQLARLAGPPAQPGIDMVVLGWSPEFFDAYNILDLFPCGSAFNVARWCDPSYDRLMRRAVRTLDDQARYEIERTLVDKLGAAVPAVPLFAASDNVYFGRGVSGFEWSPLGVYELMGMTRS